MSESERCGVCGATEFSNIADYSEIEIPGAGTRLTLCVYCSCAILGNILSEQKDQSIAAAILKDAVYQIVLDNAKMDERQAKPE